MSLSEPIARAVARPDVGSPRRLETLTDGVFSIVMTLIVLQIAVPRGPEAQLLGQLAKLLPTLVTYALTFVTLGALWFGNRTQGEFIERADHTLVWLTLLMLGFVALIPFSAALLAAFPVSRIAVVVYGVHLSVVFVVHGSLWTYVSRRPWLLREGVSESYRRRARVASFLPAIGYAIPTVIGAVAPLAGLVGFLLVPVPLVAGVFYRWLARIHAESQRPRP